MSASFAQQVPRGWDADALESLGRLAGGELRRVAGQHDGALLSCFDRPVRREVERDRRARRVQRARCGEVEDPHRVSLRRGFSRVYAGDVDTSVIPFRSRSAGCHDRKLAIAGPRCHDGVVTTTAAEDAVARGYGALASGKWGDARDPFQEVLDLSDSPEALDGARPGALVRYYVSVSPSPAARATRRASARSATWSLARMPET